MGVSQRPTRKVSIRYVIFSHTSDRLEQRLLVECLTLVLFKVWVRAAWILRSIILSALTVGSWGDVQGSDVAADLDCALTMISTLG
jgi:hypothetical protein